ncbi:hypothetical protein K501DRAFT_326361 [Backusella circina FSU 941]|nr:hypothetical protein K501DRAFT_326361 [Backusella circina FSU 941]
MRVQIRSPSLNQTLDVNLDLNSTVWNLKQEIQQKHPQHPLPSNQRIIFSGKLLENDDSLDSILKKLEDSVVPIFHLVVKPSLLSSRQKAVEAKTMSSSQSTSSSTPSIQARASTTPLYPPALPGGYQLVALNGQYYLAPVLVPANPVPQTTDANTLLQASNAQTHSNNNQFNDGTLPQNQAAPQQQQQQQQGIRPILIRPANAQRAASIWLALKLYFVVFILCQGASLERILLFHAIALVMFMYQTGRLRVVVRRIRVVRNPQAIRDPPPPPPQPQQEQQNTPETTTTNNNTQNNRSPAPPQVPATRLEILKRGIYMFIASFWPNYGRDPRIAQAFENEQRQA